MEIFGNFGNVIYCDLPMDKQKSWINTSMAYVEFEKLEEADECVKKMNGGMFYEILGTQLDGFTHCFFTIMNT